MSGISKRVEFIISFVTLELQLTEGRWAELEFKRMTGNKIVWVASTHTIYTEIRDCPSGQRAYYTETKQVETR